MTLIKLSATLGLCLSAALCQGQPTLTVQGLGNSSVALSAGDLANLPQITVKSMDQGTPVTFEGVSLKEVLAKTDLPTGEEFHTTAAAYYLVVEAKDGYRAVFAWAEMDPGFMDKTILVALKRDGQPLGEKDGPFQLVAPGEKRNGRWVRQVTALKIMKAS